MKTFTSLYLLLAITLTVQAQVPNFINYQAIVRDINGDIQAYKSITFKVRILHGSSTPAELYMETHEVSTDVNGVISIKIGNGESSGSLSDVDWSMGNIYVETSYDFKDGTGYQLTNTSQMLAVPYALFAKNTEENDPVFETSIAKGITEADTALWNFVADVNTNKYINALVGIRTVPDVSPLTIKSYDPNPSDNFPYAKLLQFNDESNQKSWDMELSSHTNGVDFHINQSGVANRMTFKSDGNIGIGTDIPSAKLDVRSEGVDNAPLFNLGNSDNSHYILTFGGRKNDPNPFIARSYTDPLRFGTFDTNGVWDEQMRIDANGKLGIGTETPSESLSVNGVIESITGGVKFPDGSVQSTASVPTSLVNDLINRIEDLENILYSVNDIEGNSYPFVKIGNQYWMAKNLKINKFNDGTSIPNVTGTAEWDNLTTPGYCWYNNDSVTYAQAFGALYNWYAVETGKLCPVGWHVPTDSDWSILVSYLGGNTVAGGKMKSSGTEYWLTPNTGASNESEFSGLPGMGRDGSGLWKNAGSFGEWWFATEVSSTGAYFIYLSYDTEQSQQFSENKDAGLSVRCIKD